MYLALLMVLAAWSVFLAHPLALIVLPLFVAYMTRFQIIPEERDMQALFRSEFDSYRTRTRRWI
jgi:protein-S-isoprenylcysteine O-methyltransferase Ste14